MGTRAIIARATEGGGFTGRYLHQDGTPETAVELLRDFVRNVHGGDIAAATRVLLDEHPYGWVSLPASDGAGECFCHSGSDESRLDAGLLTDKEGAPPDVAYAYVLHPEHITVLVPGDGTGWTPIYNAPWPA